MRDVALANLLWPAAIKRFGTMMDQSGEARPAQPVAGKNRRAI